LAASSRALAGIGILARGRTVKGPFAQAGLFGLGVRQVTLVDAEAAQQCADELLSEDFGCPEQVCGTCCRGLLVAVYIVRLHLIIDIDLTVADPRDEDRYVPRLARIGYTLTVREPSWHEHRCLRLAEPRVNLHVFGPNCPEVIRHRMFRDWLRDHPEDRARYEDAKRAAVPGGGHVMDYNAREQETVHAIMTGSSVRRECCRHPDNSHTRHPLNR
jgi:hypothetical protein